MMFYMFFKLFNTSIYDANKFLWTSLFIFFMSITLIATVSSKNISRFTGQIIAAFIYLTGIATPYIFIKDIGVIL